MIIKLINGIIVWIMIYIVVSCVLFFDIDVIVLVVIVGSVLLDVSKVGKYWLKLIVSFNVYVIIMVLNNEGSLIW